MGFNCAKVKREYNSMRIFIWLSFIVSLSYCGLINAIAFKVGDDVVTLYDIDKTINQKGLSKKDAVEYLTIEILKKQAIKKFGITVLEQELDRGIRNIANRNKMTLEQFMSMLASRMIDFDTYKQGLRRQMLDQKLFAYISRNNTSSPSLEEMNIFYNNNKELFVAKGKVELIRYKAQNQQSLLKAINSPLLVLQDVEKEELLYDLKTLPQQRLQIINQTKEGHFSSIVEEDNYFVAYFIKTKTDTQVLSFDEVKDKILNIILSDRQRKSAMIYFQKQKNNSNIVYIRGIK